MSDRESPDETEPTSSEPDYSHPRDDMDGGQKKTVAYIIGFIMVMFGFAWASIPLYRLVCKSLDPGGSTAQNGQSSEYKNVEVDESRTVRVHFAANVTRKLPWMFRPETKFVEVHPGEKKLVKFVSKNLDDEHAIKGKAVYDVNPPQAGQYFKKIECFCFKEQTLEPGQKRDMPLYFWFDPDLPEGIDKVNLSYTFFNATSSRKRVQRN